MNTKKMVSAALLAIGFAIAPAANAQLVGSSVAIDGHNGFQGSYCKDVNVSRPVLGGGEMLGTDWTGGCVGYYSADINNSGFTLTVRDGGNYSKAVLNMTFTGAATITGASFLGYSNSFFTSSSPNYDANFFPVVSYTGNSVSVVWDTFDDNSQFRFDDTSVGTGTAQFSIQTTRTVAPEPATFVLLGAGLGIVGFAGRRRRA